MGKLVSIGMSVFNSSDYIEDAIKSILKQTYTNWELIIINDGSTDDTREIIRSFNDERIVLIDQTNQGIAAALNYGLRLARSNLPATMRSATAN